LPIPQQDQNKTRNFWTDSAAVPALCVGLADGFAERGKDMRLLDDAIAMLGGEAEHRRRTGRWAAEMPRPETRIDHSSTVRLLGLVLKTTATAIATLQTWQRTVSRRRAIANLTADQLRDIGHAEPPVPVLEVKAGLITNLISAR
jgi:hypothetical protein